MFEEGGGGTLMEEGPGKVQLQKPWQDT